MYTTCLGQHDASDYVVRSAVIISGEKKWSQNCWKHYGLPTKAVFEVMACLLMRFQHIK